MAAAAMLLAARSGAGGARRACCSSILRRRLQQQQQAANCTATATTAAASAGRPTSSAAAGLAQWQRMRQAWTPSGMSRLLHCGPDVAAPSQHQQTAAWPEVGSGDGGLHLGGAPPVAPPPLALGWPALPLHPTTTPAPRPRPRPLMACHGAHPPSPSAPTTVTPFKTSTRTNTNTHHHIQANARPPFHASLPRPPHTITFTPIQLNARARGQLLERAQSCSTSRRGAVEWLQACAAQVRARVHGGGEGVRGTGGGPGCRQCVAWDGLFTGSHARACRAGLAWACRVVGANCQPTGAVRSLAAGHPCASA